MVTRLPEVTTGLGSAQMVGLGRTPGKESDLKCQGHPSPLSFPSCHSRPLLHWSPSAQTHHAPPAAVLGLKQEVWGRTHLLVPGPMSPDTDLEKSPMRTVPTPTQTLQACSGALGTGARPGAESVSPPLEVLSPQSLSESWGLSGTRIWEEKGPHPTSFPRAHRGREGW